MGPHHHRQTSVPLRARERVPRHARSRSVASPPGSLRRHRPQVKGAPRGAALEVFDLSAGLGTFRHFRTTRSPATARKFKIKVSAAPPSGSDVQRVGCRPTATTRTHGRAGFRVFVAGGLGEPPPGLDLESSPPEELLHTIEAILRVSTTRHRENKERAREVAGRHARWEELRVRGESAVPHRLLAWPGASRRVGSRDDRTARQDRADPSAGVEHTVPCRSSGAMPTPGGRQSRAGVAGHGVSLRRSKRGASRPTSPGAPRYSGARCRGRVPTARTSCAAASPIRSCARSTAPDTIGMAQPGPAEP